MNKFEDWYHFLLQKNWGFGKKTIDRDLQKGIHY